MLFNFVLTFSFELFIVTRAIRTIITEDTCIRSLCLWPFVLHRDCSHHLHTHYEDNLSLVVVLNV